MILTHLDEKDHPKMVDVSDKTPTTRVAIASGTITMSQEAYTMVVSEKAKKGPVLQTAIIAAIQGTKRTPELIPMCHPLLLSSIHCDVEELPALPGFKLSVTAKLTGQTGVEMEALTGTSIGLLTIYDMVKAIDKGMIISNVQLESKAEAKVATTCDLNLANKEVQIDYPCHWEYKVIVHAHVDIKTPLAQILETREYSLTLSNNSKAGTYTSYSARVLVTSHEERKALFNALKAHPSIKYVL